MNLSAFAATAFRNRRRVYTLGVAMALYGGTAGAWMGDTSAPPSHLTARDALAKERETLDGVVAAALVGALSEQLGGRAVKIRLDRIDVQPSSLRDRTVSGVGQLQIDGAEDWIGFRFNTLYDAISASAGYPDVSIGTVGPTGKAVPNDAKLIGELDERVVGMLDREFGHQRVRLQLDRIDTIATGARYLRIDASGVADFGRDGSAPTRVEALYDREQNAWLRVSYALEPADEPAVGASPRPAGG